ncbi:uncharacterized protein [Amphiura filiformis]
MSTMLIDYAKKGDTKECQKLLSKSSVDPNRTDWNGKAPLHYAAANGHTPTCEILIQNKANVNLRGRFDGMTPLMCAAENRHWQTCQKLVELQADKRSTDVHFMCYTDHAAHHKHGLLRQMTI